MKNKNFHFFYAPIHSYAPTGWQNRTYYLRKWNISFIFKRFSVSDFWCEHFCQPEPPESMLERYPWYPDRIISIRGTLIASEVPNKIWFILATLVGWVKSSRWALPNESEWRCPILFVSWHSSNESFDQTIRMRSKNHIAERRWRNARESMTQDIQRLFWEQKHLLQFNSTR